MAQVNVTKSIKVPAVKAWENIASFRGIEKISPIERSVVTGEGVGTKRSCFLPDNSEIKEELIGLDSNNMLLEYKIISGPFPVENYVSQVKVSAQGDSQCEISWSSSYDTASENEAAMGELFGGFYNVIIEGLEGLIAS